MSSAVTSHEVVPGKKAKAAVRTQRWQDFLFHKLTLGFALLVLLVLMGILVALMVGA
ncbi:MAG: phosphate ABC transporter permease subunit PstC, partial [Oxalobacter sp.]